MADRFFYEKNQSLLSGLTTVMATFDFRGTNSTQSVTLVAASTTVTVASTATLQVGDELASFNLPSGSRVLEILGPTTFRIQGPPDVSLTETAVVTRPGQPANLVGHGIRSITRAGVSTYNITFEDEYPHLLSASCNLQSDTTVTVDYPLALFSPLGTFAFTATTTAGSPTLENVSIDANTLSVGDKISIFRSFTTTEPSTIISIPDSSTIVLNDDVVFPAVTTTLFAQLGGPIIAFNIQEDFRIFTPEPTTSTDASASLLFHFTTLLSESSGDRIDG